MEQVVKSVWLLLELLSKPEAIACEWLVVAFYATAYNFAQWHKNGRKVGPHAPAWISVVYIWYDGIVIVPLALGAEVVSLVWLGSYAVGGDWLSLGFFWTMAMAYVALAFQLTTRWQRYHGIVLEGLEKAPVMTSLCIVKEFVLLPGIIAHEWARALGQGIFATVVIGGRMGILAILRSARPKGQR